MVSPNKNDNMSSPNKVKDASESALGQRELRKVAPARRK